MRRGERHIGKNTMRRWRQRLECYSYKARNSKDGRHLQKLEEARPSPWAFRENGPANTLIADFWLPELGDGNGYNYMVSLAWSSAEFGGTEGSVSHFLGPIRVCGGDKNSKWHIHLLLSVSNVKAIPLKKESFFWTCTFRWLWGEGMQVVGKWMLCFEWENIGHQ